MESARGEVKLIILCENLSNHILISPLPPLFFHVCVLCSDLEQMRSLLFVFHKFLLQDSSLLVST